MRISTQREVQLPTNNSKQEAFKTKFSYLDSTYKSLAYGLHEINSIISSLWSSLSKGASWSYSSLSKMVFFWKATHLNKYSSENATYALVKQTVPSPLYYMPKTDSSNWEVISFWSQGKSIKKKTPSSSHSWSFFSLCPVNQIWKTVSSNSSPLPNSVKLLHPDENELFTKENWSDHGKEIMPRVLLACLHKLKAQASHNVENIKEQIQKINRYLCTLTPWSQPEHVGLKDFQHLWKAIRRLVFTSRYDDFSTTVLTRILYQFGDSEDILYPETRKHLLENVLKLDGSDFPVSNPGTFGLIDETENHVLMIAGSMYLKNSWLQKAGNTEACFDNKKNAVEAKLVDYLKDLKTKGLREFNSRPYAGYTMTALLNLYDFAESEVKKQAGELLDLIAYQYALSSCDYKRFPIFARQQAYEKETSLVNCAITPYMRVWMGEDVDCYVRETYHTSAKHALIALTSSYKIPQNVQSILRQEPSSYFATIRQRWSAVEIYHSCKTAQGEKYLLSAGGTYSKWHRWRWEVIPRPITLILEGGSESDLSQSFYLGTELSSKKPGVDATKRNNTGVYQNFACARCPVHIPAHLTPKIESQRSNWKLYEPRSGLTAAVFSKKQLGILVLFPQKPSEQLLNAIENANPCSHRLESQFVFPEDKRCLTYDVNTPSARWVMISDSKASAPLERNFRKWDFTHVNLEPMAS